MKPHSALPGRRLPLGAHVSDDRDGTFFSLFSANATGVTLCLFDQHGRESARIVLPDPVDHVWSAFVPGVAAGQRYGYRVDGPYEPERGHRFNPHKLLLDPYARAIDGAFATGAHADLLLGYRSDDARKDLAVDRRDSAAAMPRCVVTAPVDAYAEPRPATRWPDTFIYELNVRGATMTHPGMSQSLRGTYSGLSSPAMLDHLVTLGVTAVELLPVQAFTDEPHLVAQGMRNAWGYNSIGFFAPMSRYLCARTAAQDAVSEFRAMVAALHGAGIEVVLDVVYNHTAEGSELGPTLSFRGIDNASYYRLLESNPRYYINDSGCGNTLDLNHPNVLALTMDSLRYWHEVMGVDGFRFDLATSLGRETTGFNTHSPLLCAMRQDPSLSDAKLIAEPWDVGPGGYQLGGFGPLFREWNDQYRDGVRRFWRGDDAMVADLASSLLGSSRTFDGNGRPASASINFVCSHDGFTLADLVSHVSKHNDANGEDNRDGHNANYSFNCGAEGDVADPEILRLRARQQRNLLATVLLSHGTPMLLAGDEFGNSQGGNNNAYCQDNAIGWLDWSLLDTPAGAELCAFAGRLSALRAAHPVFRRPRFLHGQAVSPEGVPSVTWLRPDGRQKMEADWHKGWARSVALMLCGTAGDFYDHHGKRLFDDTLLLLFNAHDDAVAFTLLDVHDDTEWECLLDTALVRDGERVAGGGAIDIADRSLSLWRMSCPLDSTGCTGPVSRHGNP